MKRKWFLLRWAEALVVCIPYVMLAQFTNVPIVNEAHDQSECSITLHPTTRSTQLATYHDFRNGVPEPGYARSTDLGTTWSPLILTRPSGYQRGFDPSGAINRSSKYFYCYAATVGDPFTTRWNVFVSYTTTPTQQDWTDVNLSTSLTYQIHDKPYMAIDNTGGSRDGYLYASWTAGNDVYLTNSETRFSRSTNNGVSWSTTPLLLDSESGQAASGSVTTAPESPTLGPGGGLSIGAVHYLEFSMPAVGPNGEVYVIWADVYSDTPPLYNGSTFKIRKSTDGGSSFATAVTMPSFTYQRNLIGQLDIRNIPSMAVDLNTGYVFVVYKDAASSTNLSPRIKITKSVDGGTTWSTPAIIGVVGTDPNAWQFFPWISIQESGKIAVAYMHATSGSPRMVDCYLIESVDQGQTFGTPIRVSDVSSNPVGSIWTHHYMGLASSQGLDFPVWNDYRTSTSDGKADIYWVCANTGTVTSNSVNASYAGTGAKKTIYSTPRWHLTYQSAGKTYYAFSDDEAVHWGDYSVISGAVPVQSNSSPAIALYGGNPYVVFTNVDSGVYFNRKVTGQWLSQPRKLVTSAAECAAFTIDGSGTGHVVWGDNPPIGPTTHTLYYGTFTVTNDLASMQNVTNLDISGSTYPPPATVLDSNGKPHVVWSDEGEIYYRNKVGSNWSSTTNISSNSGTSTYPTICNNGTTIYVAWQDNTTGNDEIYYRVRTASWGTTQNVSNNSAASTHPSINGPADGFPVILWSDYTGNNWDIKHTWMGDQIVYTYSTTTGVSSDPSFSFKSIGTHTYRLYSIWTEGSSAPFEIYDITKDISTSPAKIAVANETHRFSNLPEQLAVHNFPNPFNPKTTFVYHIPSDGLVTLTIYDILGQEVSTLIKETQSAGQHSIEFEGGMLASGMYVYRLSHGNGSVMGKMLLSK